MSGPSKNLGKKAIEAMEIYLQWHQSYCGQNASFDKEVRDIIKSLKDLQPDMDNEKTKAFLLDKAQHKLYIPETHLPQLLRSLGETGEVPAKLSHIFAKAPEAQVAVKQILFQREIKIEKSKPVDEPPSSIPPTPSVKT